MGAQGFQSPAVLQVLRTQFIFVPPRNRCCITHLENGRFTDDAMSSITSRNANLTLTGSEITRWVKQLVDALNKKTSILDFGPEFQFTEDDYHLFLGVNRTQFFEMFNFCRPHLHASRNRSAENALAILLIKLRLDLPQSVIALLFGVDSQQRVSETIKHVAETLDKVFVPQNLGYGHRSREELMEHDSDFFHEILETPPESLHKIVDATYLHIQQPSNHELQMKTFSMHKHYNLVKPSLTVCPDNYIEAVDGPSYCDYSNNDANVFQMILEKRGPGSLSSVLEEGDVFIFDRGLLLLLSFSEQLLHVC